MASFKTKSAKFTATNLLILSFVAVFAYQMYLLFNFGQSGFRGFVELYAFKENAFLAGEYYRAFTSIFMHAGIFHLFSNSAILYLAGNPLERKIGSIKFAFLFLLSGVVGSLLTVALLDLGVPALGASGGVFGVLAAASLLVPTNSYLEEIPVLRKLSLPIVRLLFSVTILGVYFVFQETVMASLQVYSTVSDNVGHVAHFGGIATGAILSFLWYPQESRHSVKYSVPLLVLLLSLVLVPPFTNIWFGLLAVLILFLVIWKKNRKDKVGSFNLN